MTDKEKIRDEIERLISSMERQPKVNETQALVYSANKTILYKLLGFIDSMQEEVTKQGIIIKED